MEDLWFLYGCSAGDVFDTVAFPNKMYSASHCAKYKTQQNVLETTHPTNFVFFTRIDNEEIYGSPNKKVSTVRQQ